MEVRIMLRFTAVITAVYLGGCSGIDVAHDYDPMTDFSKLKTWTWVPPKEVKEDVVPKISGLTDNRIRGAIETELNAKQYQKVESGTADFLVRYAVNVGQRIEDYSGNGWYGNDLYVYTQGTLIIDMLSGKDKRLLWRGSARTQVEYNMTPQERDERIKEAVHMIMEDFPPKTAGTPAPAAEAK
jgi:hypothetical protein